MKLTDGERNACLDSGFGPSFDSGILELRTGAAPANAGDALTGTVLATIALPADAFSAAAAGVASKAGTWQDSSADAAGTAGHAVMRFAADTTGADNTVKRVLYTLTATGGGGEIEIDNTNIAAGQQITVSSFDVTQPAS